MELTSVKTINEIKKKFGFEFKKGLGQNFLTDSSVLYDIACAAQPGYGVLEIGPGFGVLTQELSQQFEKVVCVEIDSRLTQVLKYTLADCNNITVINDDVLKCDLASLIKSEFGDKKISIAANLPYYITTPIITSIIEKRLNISCMVVMIQKEVAKRLCAEPATKDYGAISVLCQYYTVPEIITEVSADKFIPRPKVDSAVIKMTIRDKPRVEVSDEKLFFRTVKAAFAQRRKTLLNCLCAAFPYGRDEVVERMNDAGIEPSRRGETLSIEEFAILSEKMKN